MAWLTIELPADFKRAWRAQNPVDDPPIARRNGQLTALIGREHWRGESQPRWHISLRYGDPGVNGRVPTWEEIVMACHELRPGVPFVMGVPPRSWWVNTHPDVLHMWEARDPALVAQWRENAQGQRPT